MKTSELSPKAFEEVKEDLEKSQMLAARQKFLQLLKNLLPSCSGCPIYEDCHYSNKIIQ